MKLSLVHDRTLPTGALGLAITPDGSRAFAGCTDGSIYDVELATGHAEPFDGQHQSFASACVLLPDGGREVADGGPEGRELAHAEG